MGVLGTYGIAVRDGEVTTTIPEPSTWILLGIGLAGITVISIRKRQYPSLPEVIMFDNNFVSSF